MFSLPRELLDRILLPLGWDVVVHIAPLHSLQCSALRVLVDHNCAHKSKYEVALFRWCCKKDHDVVLRAIPLFIAQVRAYNNAAIRYAAVDGHAHVLELLFDRFPQLNVDDARARNNYAIGSAAYNGHAHVLELLFDRFPQLDVDDVRARNNYAFRWAAINGQSCCSSASRNRPSTMCARLQ